MKPLRCPCERRCRGKDEDAVNMILIMGALTSRELSRKLISECGETKSKAKRTIRFLHHETRKGEKFGCAYITVLNRKAADGSSKIVWFDGKSRLFVSNSISKPELNRKVRALNTRLQNQILDCLEKNVFKSFYLSSYECRKLFPVRGDYVGDALQRLVERGLVSKMTVNCPRAFYEVKLFEDIARMLDEARKGHGPLDLDFYAAYDDTFYLNNNRAEAAISEMTDYKILELVRTTLMKLYPAGLVESYKGCVRSSKESIVRQAKGMSFDIFLPLNLPINGNKYIAIDVFTRFPIRDQVVRCFQEKLEAIGNVYGIILASSESGTRRASYMCRELGIGYSLLETIGISYDNALGEKAQKFKEFQKIYEKTNG